MKYNGVKVVGKLDGWRIVALDAPWFNQEPMVGDVFEWEGRIAAITERGTRDVTDDYIALFDPHWLIEVEVEETYESIRDMTRG